MWTSDISSIVFTRIKVEAGKILKDKYPNIYFTNSDKVQIDPKFPTILVREIGSVETGNDLENQTINAILCTFQVDVTDNQSQNRVKDVMDKVISSLKGMRFSVTAMPEFQNTGDIYRQVARFRRVIGAGDIL